MDLATSESVRNPSNIADIIKTDVLWQRVAAGPNVEAEAAAMHHLGDVLEGDPHAIFNESAKIGLELCHAHSCGISLRDHGQDGEDIFRWVAIAGQLEEFVHGTMPRSFSPCGVCVGSGKPLLMQYPERFYTYIDLGKPICEVLLIPLTEPGEQLEGTIWIVAHDEQRRFDGEDARVMQRLAAFVVAALKLAKAAKNARALASEKELAFQELDHRVKNTLAMTAGMLRHQLRQVSEPTARAIIEAASSQVLAVGRVHQVAEGEERVDLAAVIASICTEMLQGDPRFELILDTESTRLPANKASVLALIANELVTNAIKHGLGNAESGTVRVGLHRASEGHLCLSVTDSGAPLPSGTDASAGQGLNLVNRLAKQLGGELLVDTAPKCFTVIFRSTHC